MKNKYYKACKVRLYPNTSQIGLLAQSFGACRWVYNHYLEKKERYYKQTKKNMSFIDMVNDLVLLKRKESTKWLQVPNSQSLQASLYHLDQAYKGFFIGKNQHPKFKKKYGKQSCAFPQHSQVDETGNYLQLVKIGWIRMRGYKHSEGKVKTVTVTLSPSGKYYASILFEIQEKITVLNIKKKKVIGVDMGLKTFVVTNKGRKYKYPKYYSKSQVKLKRLQQNLSRKKKGSANRNKARLKVARLHEKIANQRKDFHHKLSRKLVDKNHAIGVESLKVKEILSNKILSKNISDAGWSKFLSKLDYKMEWKGGRVLYADPCYPSTRICSSCGCLHEKLELSIRRWQCADCGKAHDRDKNAAKNLRIEALHQLRAEGTPV